MKPDVVEKEVGEHLSPMAVYVSAEHTTIFTEGECAAQPHNDAENTQSTEAAREEVESNPQNEAEEHAAKPTEASIRSKPESHVHPQAPTSKPVLGMDIAFTTTGDACKIIKVLPGSLAEVHGVSVGDNLLQVNHRKLNFQEPEQVRKALSLVGDTVLTVLKPHSEVPTELLVKIDGKSPRIDGGKQEEGAGTGVKDAKTDAEVGKWTGHRDAPSYALHEENQTVLVEKCFHSDNALKLRKVDRDASLRALQKDLLALENAEIA